MESAIKPHALEKQELQDTKVSHQHDFVEVWGDTVSLSALSKSIAIGAILSISFFYSSKWILEKYSENQVLAHAYSMLFGLLGCLIAGFLCAILFKPKRKILQSSNESMQWIQALIEEWEKEGESIGNVEDLPEKITLELKELNLYEAFVEYARLHQQKEGL